MSAPSRQSRRRTLRVGAALTLCAALAAPACAQQTPVAASAASELGRLFFTPERRQQLDRQRLLKVKDKPAIADDPTLTINGVVTRSSGKRTVWINGVAQNDNERPGGTAVRTSHQAPGLVVVEPADAPSGKASVGDTIQRDSGETADLLGGGRITRRPSGAR